MYFRDFFFGNVLHQNTGSGVVLLVRADNLQKQLIQISKNTTFTCLHVTLLNCLPSEHRNSLLAWSLMIYFRKCPLSKLETRSRNGLHSPFNVRMVSVGFNFKCHKVWSVTWRVSIKSLELRKSVPPCPIHDAWIKKRDFCSIHPFLDNVKDKKKIIQDKGYRIHDSLNKRLTFSLQMYWWDRNSPTQKRREFQGPFHILSQSVLSETLLIKILPSKEELNVSNLQVHLNYLHENPGIKVSDLRVLQNTTGFKCFSEIYGSTSKFSSLNLLTRNL